MSGSQLSLIPAVACFCCGSQDETELLGFTLVARRRGVPRKSPQYCSKRIFVCFDCLIKPENKNRRRRLWSRVHASLLAGLKQQAELPNSTFERKRANQ